MGNDRSAWSERGIIIKSTGHVSAVASLICCDWPTPHGGTGFMGGLASQGLAELCCAGSVVHGPCNTADSKGVDHDWTGAERTRTSRVAWATVQPGTWSSWGSSWRLFGRYPGASEADSSSCCERLPAVAKRPERRVVRLYFACVTVILQPDCLGSASEPR
jgi:hypothetical protein